MSAGTVTQLLQKWRQGDSDALDRLVPEVYDELRRMASRQMRGERADHTIQTTALVHEAYVRLVDADVNWQDRAHFFSVAARQMRRILVDYARARGSAKRGGGMTRVTLHDYMSTSEEPAEELLRLDQALTALSERDPRKGRVVELRFFAGMTQDEISEVLGVSGGTVKRDLRFANAWLRSELGAESAGP